MFLFWILAAICAIWVVIDVLNSRMSKEKKAIWIICAFFFSIITAIIYYLVEKR